MMAERLTVKNLKKKLVEEYYAEFRKISEDVSDWGFEEFIYDLPGKWDLSLCIWSVTPIAYIVLSRKWKDRIHIHQFMVQREYRGGGVGGKLMEEVIDKHPTETFSLKVDPCNEGAIRFYGRYGFVFAGVMDGNGWMWRRSG